MNRLFPTRRSATPRLIDRFAGELDLLLSSLFDAGASGRMVCDLDGRIVRVNTGMRGLVGAEVNLERGAPAAGVFAADRREEAWSELFSLLTAGPSPHGFRAYLEGVGAPIAEVVPARLIEADGCISGLIVGFTDISVQRGLEVKLAQGQKMQAVGELAGGIAHDFNNLLTGILGAGEEIVGRAGVDPNTLEDAEQICAGAKRGAALVRQLLAFGRQQTLQPKVMAINPAVADFSLMLRRTLGTNYVLELNLEEPGRYVKVDPVQLDQVLLNLALNARDAMPDGGKIIVRTRHALLLAPMVREQETIPPGRYVVIEVLDHGFGITPEALPRIFEPFFTTRREQGGTGLGLSTVHGIARQSGGFMAVDSEVRKGTCFGLYLPRYEGEVTSPAPTLAANCSPPAPMGNRTVLIVDDEDEVRRLAVRLFGRRGWKVLDADGGDAALEMLGERGAEALDLIVSDVVMPGLDGPALVRSIRETRPDLPAILVSGYADETLRRELTSRDIKFIAKPYGLNDLADAAERLVFRSDTAREPASVAPSLRPSSL